MTPLEFADQHPAAAVIGAAYAMWLITIILWARYGGRD